MTAMPVTLALPQTMHAGAVQVLRRQWPSHRCTVVLDMARQRFVEPAGSVGLGCLIDWARAQGQEVRVAVGTCENALYWARMDFFALLGLDGPEPQGRQDPDGRFSEIRKVDDPDDVDALTEALASVTADDARSFAEHAYILSEALNNICQHSEGSGYCASQAYPSRGVARFTIADTGRGLRAALARFPLSSDAAAIAKALEVGVSGRSHVEQMMSPNKARNKGIGLTALTRLIEANGGSYVLWSGTAVRTHANGHSRMHEAAAWQGVYLAAEVPRVNFHTTYSDIIRELTPELREVERQNARPRLRRLP